MTEEKTTVKKAEKATGKLTIYLIKGLERIKPRHTATVHSLGLTRIGQSVTHPDNAAVRGMIRRVDYLIRVETL